MIASEKDFVRFKVCGNDKNLARQIRRKRDKRYGNIYKEKSTDLRWSGDLGEIKVNQALMMCNEEETEWLSDLEASGECDIVFFGKKIDVKTVKRNVRTRQSYSAQITARHINTDIDYLIFASYEVKSDELVIVGAISKKDFLLSARYYAEGEQVHEGYRIRKGHEIYNIDISKLIPFREFIRLLRRSLVEC